MPTSPSLVRVPPEAVVPPLRSGDLYSLVPVREIRPGELVVAILPGGRRLSGRLLSLAGVWWLLDALELVALTPEAELLRALIFRPI